MYKIFFNERLLGICKTTTHKVTKKTEIKPLIAQFIQNENLPELWLYAENPDETMQDVCSLFELVEAAGGLVRNTSGNCLLIQRNGCWDLPKGKGEEGESMEETALREVSEECGIHGLILNDFIVHTYHIYKDIYTPGSTQLFLKKTYWYTMSYTGTETLLPQAEEDITAACWVKPEELDTYYSSMYLSVAAVLAKIFPAMSRCSG